MSFVLGLKGIHTANLGTNMDKLPLVSVIVPVYNDEDSIEICLRTLISQNYPVKEIIVINDGSTDGTEDVLSRMLKEYPSLQIFSTKHSGITKARNTGISYSKGDIIFFGEGDAIYKQNYIKNAVELLTKDSKVGGVCLTGAPWIVKQTFVTHSVNFENKIMRRLVASGKTQASYAWIFRKDVLDDVGGFDERLFQGEDKDIFLRVKQAGYSIGLVTGVNWRHIRNQTLLNFAKRNYEGAKTRTLYLLKHHKTWELFSGIFLFWLFVLGLLLALLFPPFIYLSLIALALRISYRLIFMVRFGRNVFKKKRHFLFFLCFTLMRYMISAIGYSHGLLIVFSKKLRGKTVDWSSM